MSEFENKAFLGRGWSFPVALTSERTARLVEYEDDIRQAILLILETAQGERLMRPDFGAGLEKLIFEPINQTTISLVQHRVEQALVTWEPRIDQIEVTVTPGGPGLNLPEGQRAASEQRPRPKGGTYLEIEIHYRVRRTNTFYNLVYPFYLREGRP